MKRLFSDLDNDPLRIVKKFFSEHDGLNFKSCLQNILAGIGYRDVYAMCSFPSELEPDEKSFEGVKFSMWENEELVVSHDCFIEVLKEAVKRYFQLNPKVAPEL